MNKQELIDKCVHHFGGVFPQCLGKCDFISLRVGNGGIYAPYYVTYERAEDTICTREEFEKRAASLGYVPETISAEPDSWYDYTNQKALRLPPIGEVCQMYAAALWFDVKMIAEDDGKPIVKYLECGNYYPASPTEEFYRPLDCAACKAEAVRENTIDHLYYKYPNEVDEGGMALLELLYDAGFLRMPEDK